MASSEPERSLVGGISLPQWMKSKIADRYDLEQSAFSPPTDDDGFFLIRYPKAKPVEPEPKVIKAGTKYTAITKVLSEKPEVSFSQHTEPCQEFIPQAKITPRDIGLRRGVDPPLGKVKSTGTDDGFKGEGAACGYSVVAVAQQMLSEKERSSSSDDENKLSLPKYERIRRNSKSLPASPQTSPKLLRKNPYFASILFGSTEIVHESGVPRKTGSLLSAAIESQKSSVEDVSGVGKMSRAQSEEAKSLRAKPSHLREMNFWSPTSM